MHATPDATGDDSRRVPRPARNARCGAGRVKRGARTHAQSARARRAAVGDDGCVVHCCGASRAPSLVVWSAGGGHYAKLGPIVQPVVSTLLAGVRAYSRASSIRLSHASVAGATIAFNLTSSDVVRPGDIFVWVGEAGRRLVPWRHLRRRGVGLDVARVERGEARVHSAPQRWLEVGGAPPRLTAIEQRDATIKSRRAHLRVPAQRSMGAIRRPACQ